MSLDQKLGGTVLNFGENRCAADFELILEEVLEGYDGLRLVAAVARSSINTN